MSEVMVVLGAVSLAVASVYGLLDSSPAWVHPRAKFSVFTLTNPNHSASLGVLCTASSVVAWSAAPTRTLSLAYAMAAAVFSTVTFSTHSRGGAAALILTILVFFAVHGRRSVRSTRQAALWSVLALGSVAFAFAWDRYEFARGFRSGSGTPWDSKLAAFRDSPEMIREHFMFGIGRWAYGSVYPAYLNDPLHVQYLRAENLFVQYASDFGWFGILLAGGLSYLVLQRFWSQTETGPQIIAASLVGVWAQNLVDFSLEVPGVALPFAVLLAGLSSRTKRESKRTAGSLAAWPVLGIAVAFLLFQAVQSPSSRASVERIASLESRDIDWDAMIRQHPANAIISIHAASAALQTAPNNVRESVRRLEHALRRAPTSADVHAQAAALLLQQGFEDQSRSHMRRALRDASKERRPLFVRLLRERFGSCETQLKSLPIRDPILEDLEAVAATAFIGAAQKDGDVTCAKAALLRVAPQHVPDRLRPWLAELSVRLHVPRLALELLSELPGKATNDKTRMIEIRALHALNDVDRLEKYIGDVDLERPAPALKLLAEDLLARDEGRRALAVLQRLERHLRQTSAEQASFARLRARAWSLVGRHRNALTDLNSALTRYPRDPELRLERARTYLALDNVAAARRDLELTVKWNPEFQPARRLLGQLTSPARSSTAGARSSD
jgi:hypothetical protein